MSETEKPSADHPTSLTSPSLHGWEEKWVRFEDRERLPQIHHNMPPKGQRPLALPPPHRTWDVAGHRRGASAWSFRQPWGESGGWRPHAPEAELGGKPPSAAICREAELVRRKKSARQPQARASPAPFAPPLEREPPAEVLRRALPGVVWSPPPRVCGLWAAAAAAALGLGARSDVTAMAGIKALISLSFGGAIGLMFLMLGCALPIYNQYWPLFVLFFYILSPIPYCIARRLVDDTDAMSNACKELAIFLTTGIVVSAFGLPVVFARAHLIEWGACALVLTGNTVIFATILGFFLVFGSNDDFSWQQWWKKLLNYCQMDFLSFVGHPCTQEMRQPCWMGIASLLGVF